MIIFYFVLFYWVVVIPPPPPSPSLVWQKFPARGPEKIERNTCLMIFHINTKRQDHGGALPKLAPHAHWLCKGAVNRIELN